MTSDALVLGLGWGVVIAAPIARRARRRVVEARRTELLSEPAGRRATCGGHGVDVTRIRALPGVRVFAALARRRSTRDRDAALQRELPVALDILAVAVRSGATPYVAVELVAPWAPPTMAPALRELSHACAMGATFAEAIERVARREEALRPLVGALAASDRYGAPVGDRLSERAADARAAWRRRADAHARRVPVRLLFPLVFLVLPAFAALTVVPELLVGFGSA